MELFWKTAAGVIIAAALALQLGKQEMGMLLKIAACTMAAAAAISYFRPVIDFLNELEKIGDLRSDFLLILLKSVGIGLTAEVASMACTDAGSPSLGKALNLLGTAAILYQSLPVFTTMIDLIRQIAGGV